MRKILHFRLLIGLLSLFSFNSCAIYQQEFDSKPPSGVPGTSETDLENMIIETGSGPDLFIPRDQENPCSYRKCKEGTMPPLNCKVWVCSHLAEDGCAIQGHYIYQTSLKNFNCLESSDLNDSKIQFITNRE